MADFLGLCQRAVLNGLCLGPLPYSLEEPLSRCFESGSEVADFFDFFRGCSEWFELRSSSFLAGATLRAVEQMIGE